jgi:membrane-bound lytic murein transglycosylase A
MIAARWCAQYRVARQVFATAGAVLLLGLVAQSGHAGGHHRATRSVEPEAASDPAGEPLKLPNSQLEPIDWSALEGWAADDHAAAFATLLASCRPLLRAAPPKGETRPMYSALKEVCRRALSAGSLAAEPARLFFERNFRPVRIARLGDSTGLLTGYYEPIIEGSRFPTPVFKVPIYRRPPDLVPPRNGTGPGFPNKGQSLRRTGSGELKPYYDRGEILDGALAAKYLEICWIKDDADALTIQLQGSARVRLEDGVVVRLNYDGHNGYPFVPVSRVLIERKIIPREEMSLHRIRAWMRENPEAAEEVRRQNRNFVFFRIAGLYDERDGAGREAVGAQGVPLTPERSLAVDNALHVYGTPFFIEAGLPLAGDRRADGFRRLMIAQDTGSAMVGPARADIFWGAGERAGQVAGRIRHPGSFAMLVPMEIDPVAAGRRMPLPPEKPPPAAAVSAKTTPPKSESAETRLPRPPIMARTPSPTSERAQARRAKPVITPPPKPFSLTKRRDLKRAAPVDRDRRGRARQRTVTTGSGW